MRPTVPPTRRGSNAAKHYDREQLTALVSLIAIINASSRLCVITGSPGATTSPASSDNEDSPAWRERHELSA